MKNIIYIFTMVLFTATIYGQSCNCHDNFAWMKKTFEENDAGFTYVLDQKGQEEYDKHNAAFSEKAASITDQDACVAMMMEWLYFFRKGHIGITDRSPFDPPLTTASEPTTKDAPDHWESIPVDEAKFMDHLDQKKNHDLEGIWTTAGYRIAIKKEEGGYVGVILASEGVTWKKDQVKLRLNEVDGTATYFMGDRSSRVFDGFEQVGNQFMQLGFISLHRVYPKLKEDALVANHFRWMETEEPLVEVLNKKTIILRIPSFDMNAKTAIDSVLKANKAQIASTENLIIDLRNNGGGSDESYEKLLPIIYTNPIRVVGMELLSTPLNNNRMNKLIALDNVPEETKIWAKESLEMLNQHLGEFVNLDSSMVEEITYESIQEYPKNVGIIINEGCGSTTEQFLLAAKQSKKVKLFGTTTFGILDISNMNFTPSPCKDFYLGYCLSKSFRIPDMMIDGKGLQPDYYMDASISKYGWVAFTKNILEGEK